MGAKKSTLNSNAKNQQCNYTELHTTLREMGGILRTYVKEDSEFVTNESVKVKTEDLSRLLRLFMAVSTFCECQDESRLRIKSHTDSLPPHYIAKAELTVKSPLIKPKNKKVTGFLFMKCIQIISPIQTNTTTEVSPAVKRLCNDLKKRYKCILCGDIEVTSEKFPLVVLCPVSSRLEPDIDHVLSVVKRKMPFAVLLIHTSLENSLPIIPTASKLTHNEKYKHVEFIDIAFNTDLKLYSCKMNNTAKCQLKSFFTSFFKK
ncbi:uncharacterized protein LOC132717668 [Ruditapes philippinarum]|uniref:uncharacterized protein LOC132717668 n=1 Tax=Ruditapes philippinarum TaxID=129788 RepID=UPI00295BA592|nr:uncharacterized protein LOC132717668 [Ruditapes philippinarum]